MRLCLHLQKRYESMLVVRSKQIGCRAPAPKSASLPVEKILFIFQFLNNNTFGLLCSIVM